uniref:Uncharacterized protein n=1 Tax=Amphora coffeiformis TaxID=265554 RepID=A0A7S3LCG8_9STRA
MSTTDSETSAAVVSLYQSWAGGASLCGTSPSHTKYSRTSADRDSTTEELGCFTITTTTITVDSACLESNNSVWYDTIQGDDEITLQGLDDEVIEDTVEETCLLQALKKRLSSELDIPQIPLLKRRRRPVCHFINYLGKRNTEQDPEKAPPPPPIVVEDPCQWHVGLGLDEVDALFPMMLDDSESDDDGDEDSVLNNLLGTSAIVGGKNVFAGKCR